jgi:hypothetical protein
VHIRPIDHIRLGRRGAIAALAAATGVLLGSVSPGGQPASARQAEPPLDSGGLGLPRAAIEANWGPGAGPFAGPGHYFDIYEFYTYQLTGAIHHVAYQTIGNEQIARYVQIDWLGDGVTGPVLRDVVARLIPADARLTDLYWAPPTPGGPLALVSYRYVSETLGAAYNGVLAPEILVISHEVWGRPSAPDGTQVNAVSIIARERTQATQ